MITNKPNQVDFERQSIQYLIQALDLIITNDPSSDDIEEHGVNKEDYWKYHQGILNNSLTLMFLSVENYLKKEICAISPLLLLTGEPKKWGVSKSNKKYSELFIHSFDDLLVLYQELGLGQITEQTASKLEELRIKRNQITHGVLEGIITPKYVLETFYTLMVHVWGSRIWWDQLKSHVFNEPLFGIYDTDHERASVTFYITFLISYLGKSKTGEMLGVNLKQRNYYCPSCNYWLNHEVDVGDSNFAVLTPNTPTSTSLYCIVCDTVYDVERVKCKEPDCKGNVIGGDGYCLTCFSEQYEDS
ncbi:MAG: hypothetical protein JAY85_11215 [Candidatus Thiodiazotropha weberae]|uniref:hypothetical protein n=1 Tax=Candidatus Thiodiazotropha endoloripes TaxID=1818881 RepID=UPI00083D451E|nr:hypothetical protein [Candidatus Thiodiazotropha endoloripes]MCG7899015.1 hypothetical protein [Candidatus Thiodiazotropha weberae]ODB90630.1 hypothetical protein A3195_03945 [Candidatus Thiodiazotropha endoloripes]